MKDPIVEEIRRARDAHGKHFNYDLDAICDQIRKRGRSPPCRPSRCPRDVQRGETGPDENVPDTVPFPDENVPDTVSFSCHF